MPLTRPCLGAGDLGTVDRDGFVAIATTAALGSATRVGDVVEPNASDFVPVAGGESFATESFVDDRIVVTHDVVVDDGRVIVDLFGLISSHVMVPAATIAMCSTELPTIDEGVVSVGEAEAETEAYSGATIGETDPNRAGDIGREGSPSTVGIRVTPRDPRGSPDRAGNPDPSVAGSKGPAAVVEGRPTPRIA